jgi:NADH-ubiquinone oxidoreductase chain 1
MTEHSAVIFVFFFLAEYASIVFMCVLTSLLFLGGYLYDVLNLISFWDIYYYAFTPEKVPMRIDNYINILIQSLAYTLSLGLKTCIMVFTFIWVRASFPRIRYDQLMSYCWVILLPIVVSFIVILPCILYGFEIIPSTIVVI